MKIAMVGPGYPYRGGLAQFNHLLYRYLSQRHQVLFLTFTRQYPRLFFPGKTQMDTSQSQSHPPTIRVLDSINPFSYWKTFKLLKHFQPDVVLFRYWMPFFAPAFGSIAMLVHHFLQAKTVFICDNIIPHERRPGDFWLTRFAFRAVDGFVLLSGQVEKELHLFRPEAPYIKLFHPVFNQFPPPVARTTALKHLNLPAKPTLLFFGFIRKYKGMDILLRSLALVKEEIDCQLIIAGEFYDNSKEYLELIQNLNLSEIVHIFDRYIPDEEVPYFFSAADVVVLPYRSATQSGIVPVCYHYLKPVIATTVGGLPEVIKEGKTGYLVPPEDPHSLAKAIVHFFAHREQQPMDQWIEQARHQFSWEHFTEELEKFLNALK